MNSDCLIFHPLLKLACRQKEIHTYIYIYIYIYCRFVHYLLFNLIDKKFTSTFRKRIFLNDEINSPRGNDIIQQSSNNFPAFLVSESRFF